MQKVQRSTKKSVDNMAKRYNINATVSNFNEGQYCYVRINVPTKKFSARWTGPWKIIKKINENLYIVLVDNKESVTNVGKMKPYKHSKYFPSENDKGTQVSHTHDTTKDYSRPVDDEDDFALIYRPITPSNTFNEDSRAQLQHEIDNSTNTGQLQVPDPETGNSGNNVADNSSPLTGINNQAADPMSSTGASVYTRLTRNNPRAARDKKPIERLEYPHDHVQVNKKWNKK